MPINDATDQEQRAQVVALCGFSATEARLFDAIFRVSAGRSQRYSRWNEGWAERPDLYLIKQGNAKALDLWRQCRDHFANHDAITLQIGTEQAQPWGELRTLAGREIPLLLKPISATRLLDTLDQLLSPSQEDALGEAILIGDDASLADLDAINRDAIDSDHESSGRGRRVLVVDDSASLRLQLDITLGKKHGMRVDFAADGVTALRKLESRSYDIIFLDVMLPDMDGFEICKRIRRQFRLKTPVVMLTSRAGRRDQLKGVMVEADSYLIKPVASEELESTLERLLG